MKNELVIEAQKVDQDNQVAKEAPEASGVQVTLFDEKQSTVHQGRITSGKLTLDVSKLKKGVYFIKIEDGKNPIIHRVLKE